MFLVDFDFLVIDPGIMFSFCNFSVLCLQWNLVLSDSTECDGFALDRVLFFFFLDMGFLYI